MECQESSNRWVSIPEENTQLEAHQQGVLPVHRRVPSFLDISGSVTAERDPWIATRRTYNFLSAAVGIPPMYPYSTPEWGDTTRVNNGEGGPPPGGR